MRIKILSLLSLALVMTMAIAIPSYGRERIRLDAGWRFHRGDPGEVAGAPITQWLWRPANRNGESQEEFTRPDYRPDDQWQKAVPGQDVFRGRRGFAWYRTELPNTPGPNRVLHFESVDDNATVYIN